MKHLCMSNYWLLVNKECLQFFQHDISYKLTTMRTYFDKWGLQINSSMCPHDFSWKFFLVCNSLLETSAPTQAMNFKLGRYKFGKITMGSLQTKVRFKQKGRRQLQVESSHANRYMHDNGWLRKSLWRWKTKVEVLILW